MNSYMDWVKRLPAEDSDYENCSCPECNKDGLSYKYFGFENDEFGWKLVWCNSCCSGIRISRTKIPGNSSALIDETEQSEFLEKLSSLRLIS